MKNKRYDILLISGFAVLIAFILAISASGVIALNKTSQLFEQTYKKSFAIWVEAEQANADLIAIHRAMKDVALSRDPTQLDAALNDANSYIAGFNKHMDVITGLDPGNKLLIDVKTAFSDWAPIRSKTIAFAEKGEYEAAAENTRTLGSAQVTLINAKMQLLIDQYKSQSGQAYQSSKNTSAASLILLILLTVIVLIIAVIISWRISRKLVNYQIKLHEEQEQLKITLDSIGDGVITTDTKRNVVKLNKVAEELTGWKTDEAFGKPFSEVFIINNAKTSEKAKDPVEEVLATDSICSLENHTTLTSKDAIVRHIADSAAPIKDRNGITSGVVMTFRDVTERKMIDDAQMYLLQFGYAVPDEDFFKSLANYLAVTLDMDYICIDSLEQECLSAQTVAIYFDGRYEENMAYALKDTPCGSVVGKTICSFPKGVRHLFPNDQILQDMAAEGYIGTTLFSTTGQPIGLIAMVSRKPMEKVKLAESLLKLVSIRAASELERRQYEKEIIKAKEEAEASNVSKSRFLANMSHEIRTPMSGIIGMINAVLSTELTDQQQEFLSLAKNASGVLLMVVNDILDYSKIDAERMKLEKSTFNINKLINEVVDLFNVSARQKGLSISANINGDIPPDLIGDHMRIRQVLSNLIGNAVKFTDKGSVTISLRKLSSFDNKVTLQFDIEDTGIGIPEENMDKLFKSFSQLDNSTTRQFGGTGLGLAISKKLIEMMEGSIWVTSRTGIGSTFSCTAVFEIAEGSSVSAALPKEGIEVIPFRKSGKYQVLLAEDDEINRKVGIHYLQKMGCRVIAAANGKEAVQLFEDNEIDLILMDVQMPVMDGFAATKKIRHLESLKNKNVPIIAMTAYALKGDREKCLQAGMDDYVSKPIDPDELYEKLNKWLKPSNNPVI